MSTDSPLAQGRRADSARRRQKVIKAINDAVAVGDDIGVSAIARRAGVDRSFLYRHADLLEQLHVLQAAGPTVGTAPQQVSRESLRTDLANAQERNARLHARNRQLETKLSEILGERAWRDSGLGAPEDIGALKRTIIKLEQQAVELRRELEERDQELAAARGANRDLMTRLNARLPPA